jgi:hypothetical protein
MAFPFIFEANWEAGTNGEWDSESDTGGLLDYPHYSTLARIPGMEVPYRGAYCARIQCGDTNDHTLTEGDIDIGAGATRYFRWYIFFSDDFTATADDTFHILELQQGGGTVEFTVGFKITASTDQILLGIGTTAPTTFGTVDFPRGRWVGLTLSVACVTASATATATVTPDFGEAVTKGSVQNGGAIGQGVFGTQATLATTTGTILLDEFVMDDGALAVMSDRFPEEIMLTKTSHALLGNGKISNITLISGAGTDCTLDVYDTDEADTSDYSNSPLHLNNTTSSELVDPAGVPFQVQRGAYVVLGGTNPRAIVQVQQGKRSRGLIRDYGIRRGA